MLKSHVIVIATSNNVDHNNISDIADAIVCCGGCDIEIADNGVIQSTLPTSEIETVKNIEGVSYVRNDMNYETECL